MPYSGWAKLDDTYHAQTCSGAAGTCDEPMKLEEHQWSAWANVDGNTHKRTCETAGCDAEQTADHNWVLDHVEDATFTAPGKTVYKCADDCGVADREESIAQLVRVDVAKLTAAKPVRGETAAKATTADTAYYVADTEWMTQDGTPLAIGGKFQPGTVYAVKITLETAGAGVFSASSTYNKIDGKTPTVSPELITPSARSSMHIRHGAANS